MRHGALTRCLGCDAIIAAVKRRGTSFAGRAVRTGRGRGHPATAAVAAAEDAGALAALEASGRELMASHRHRLAAALGAELPASSPERIERALAAESPDPAAILARTTGRSEEEIDDAFEAMARNARDARRHP